MSHPQTRYRQQAGFGLIEVLIALIILGVGLLGIGRLQLALLAGAADTAAYDSAVRLANRQIETLRFQQLSGSLPTSGSAEDSVQGRLFQRTWRVDCAAAMLCQAQVTVRWVAPSASGTEQQQITVLAYLPEGALAEQGWLVQFGLPHYETLP